MGCGGGDGWARSTLRFCNGVATSRRVAAAELTVLCFAGEGVRTPANAGSPEPCYRGSRAVGVIPPAGERRGLRNWRGVGAKTQSEPRSWLRCGAGLRAELATRLRVVWAELTLLHGRKRLPTEHQQQTSLASHAGQPLRFALRAQHVALDGGSGRWREGRQDHSAIGDIRIARGRRHALREFVRMLVDDPRASHTVPTAQRRSPPKRLTPIGRAIPTSSQFLAGGRDRASCRR